MTDHTARTRLGAPGPSPLGLHPGKPNGSGGGHQAPAGAASMTLGTLREVRNELASLSQLLDRMSTEMKGLRQAVEAVANREAPAPDAGVEKAARKAAKRAAKADAARDEREAALEARVDKLERQVRKMKRRLDWMG